MIDAGLSQRLLANQSHMRDKPTILREAQADVVSSKVTREL